MLNGKDQHVVCVLCVRLHLAQRAHGHTPINSLLSYRDGERKKEKKMKKVHRRDLGSMMKSWTSPDCFVSCGHPWSVMTWQWAGGVIMLPEKEPWSIMQMGEVPWIFIWEWCSRPTVPFRRSHAKAWTLTQKVDQWPHESRRIMVDKYVCTNKLTTIHACAKYLSFSLLSHSISLLSIFSPFMIAPLLASQRHVRRMFWSIFNRGNAPWFSAFSFCIATQIKVRIVPLISSKTWAQLCYIVFHGLARARV